MRLRIGFLNLNGYGDSGAYQLPVWEIYKPIAEIVIDIRASAQGNCRASRAAQSMRQRNGIFSACDDDRIL